VHKKVAYTSVSSYDLDQIKDALSALFISLGYNKDNPLGHIIKPGMRVFIKPNWVASRWRESCLHKDDLFCVITHPNVIEAVADFVAIALNGEGIITIGDNPSIDADFEELLETTEIARLKTKYQVPCEILDLRPLVCKDLKDYGDKEKMYKQTGDPRGYTEVNLAEKSMFNNINASLFRGVFKQRKETIEAHSGKNQLYTFANSIYNADVYISIPKMKTHHKAGVTLNLKGLVGTIGQKNQLVHWRVGFPQIGGDEYPDFYSWLKGTFFTKVKSRGSWHGNDTIWRMVVDLYHSLMTKDRKYLSVVDGILAGQGNGPFSPHSIHANTIVTGEDLLAVDIVTARLMEFNPNNIPHLRYFLENTSILREIMVLNETEIKTDFFDASNKYLNFIHPDHWKGLPVK
jgi:uncharacterized protein (DUF362 family)